MCAASCKGARHFAAREKPYIGRVIFWFSEGSCRHDYRDCGPFVRHGHGRLRRIQTARRVASGVKPNVLGRRSGISNDPLFRSLPQPCPEGRLRQECGLLDAVGFRGLAAQLKLDLLAGEAQCVQLPAAIDFAYFGCVLIRLRG